MDHILSDLFTMTCPSWRGAAERRYPVSEVRGGTVRRYPKPLSPRPGAAGGRSYPTPLSLRPGAAGGRSYPMSPCSRTGVAAGRSNPKLEARGGGREDQPHAMAARARRA